MHYVIKWIAWVLVVIGALNWGLIGFFGFNLVTAIFGVGSMLSSIVYSVVGLSAVVLVIFKCLKHKKSRK
jgi:uncharacterized protein